MKKLLGGAGDNQKLVNFDDIPTPEIVALTVGNGSGSKLFQAYLDQHEQIYMIPAYPLLYFYPHWETWEKEYKNSWDWETIMNIFCEKHASVLDSRRIQGLNGLTELGDSGKEHIQIDEMQFRTYLAHLLIEQPINSRNFLLAVHYAYALCNNEDIWKKRILVYHIHAWQYVIKYLIYDFPELKVITMTRDPRPNIERRIKGSLWSVDQAKLNQTDALVYKRRALYHQFRYNLFSGLTALNVIPPESVRVIKHEELGTDLELTMRSVAKFLNIDFSPSMTQITFGGKSWWNASIYGRKRTNKFNPGVLSQEWQGTVGKIDWFVIEGVLFDFFKKYKYPLYRYIKDTILNRFSLFVLILIPSQIERRVFFSYINPRHHIEFLKVCFAEATGTVKLRDYTWNATYLYKYTYSDLKLWKSRWYVSFLTSSLEKRNITRGCWNYAKVRLTVSHIIYIIANYTRYWWVIISYPCFVARQRMLFYKALLNRLNGEEFYPKEMNAG